MLLSNIEVRLVDLKGFFSRKLNEHFQNLEVNFQNTNFSNMRLQREVIPFKQDSFVKKDLYIKYSPAEFENIHDFNI